MGQVHADVVKELQLEGFNKDTIIIVEEVSNQAPWHLARLHRLCQAVVGTSSMFHNTSASPFAGLFTILIGDFSQLGPVKAGPPLTRAVMDLFGDEKIRSRMSKTKRRSQQSSTLIPPKQGDEIKYTEHHPYKVGAELLTQCRLFELTQQIRSHDPRHNKFIRKTYEGRSISLLDIRNLGYRIFRKSDASQTKWVHSPILVATNRERHTLSHIRAQHFAKIHNTVVIRWQTNYVRSSWKCPPNSTGLAEALEDPCLHEYFVAGADAFLTENIQRELGLVNALSTNFHSIKFDELGEAFLRECLLSARPGNIITMPRPPEVINMQVFPSPNMKQSTLKALRKLSIAPNRGQRKNPDCIILPIRPYACRADSERSIVQGSSYFLPSKVRLRRHFPIEPAFAITVHKSEGRTMDNVIIALSKSPAQGCNFSYAQFHVAMSRVKRGADIRLLLVGSTESDQWESLNYLEKLKPDPSIDYFLNGFRNVRLRSDHKSPNNNWLHNKWSPSRANTAGD